ISLNNKENDAGVLAPSQEDAIAAQSNTPVAKKTRRATRKRLESNVDESLMHPGPSKTPGTPGSRTLGSETPRRSCRKSVRPPIDYEDIVRSAKKLIPDEDDAQEDGQQPAVQKWNAAEVGKSTRKRNRKMKRLTSKKLKANQDEPESTGIDSGDKGAEVLIDKWEPAEDKQDHLEDPQQADAIDVPSEMAASKSKNKTASRKSARVTKKADTPESVPIKRKRIINYKHIVGDEDIEELGLTPLDADSCEEEDSGEKTVQDDQMAPLPIVEESTKKQESLPESSGTTEQVDQKEGMPLQPVNTSLIEDEEMASLIMIDDDDDDAEMPPLNTTFDADDQSVILVDSPVVQSASEGQKSSIKVVLTTTDDKNETLLNLEHTSQKPRGYAFPTPFITKIDFSGTPEPSGCDQNKLEKESRYGRKRSKSASRLDDVMSQKTVTFRNSPIEILSVVHIDKPWKESNNTNNVTNRHRRSKSLDERRGFTSRLPKPRIKPLPKPKPVTPSQIKKRTKLPDFSALHQKEFAKMESLVDHVERKAERAKILTTSALKKPKGSAVKQAQCSTSAADRAQVARPKAVKKIDTASEHQDKKQPPSRLPLKSALNVSAVPRPAFNLSTATVKTFNATISSKPAESQKDKLAERRQRHMDMFKGRAATKAQDKKSEFIRGVRLNRRFELQMQHRKQHEED
ncbi:hypothetical protein KR032_003426, partial [Drosophila birchii]